MDIQLHIAQYRQAISADAFEGLADFAMREELEGVGPAANAIRNETNRATDAAMCGDERSYWRAIETHQSLLFALHKKRTALLLGDIKPNSVQLDAFLVKHGWRRFRFSEINYHIRACIGGESWLFSIIPNYRQENLEKLSAFAASDERQVAIDALEMETFMQYGETERLQEILREKREGLAFSRHILRGTKASPSFVRLPLSKANSAYHVSDWTLPFRS